MGGHNLKRTKRLIANSDGNVLPLVAVGVLVSAALVGGGVDMSRAYKVQNRLQSACDSAALAGRRAVTVNGYDNAARTQANNYFNSNFNATEQGAKDTVFNTTTDDNGQTIEGTATTTMSTAVMQIFGYTKFDLSVTCMASMGVGNSDVTMVLDTTGSMDDPIPGTSSPSKISVLKTAMKSFYDTVATATQGTNARVRYAFVPYSSSVNVGHLIYDRDPNFLVNSWTIQSRKPIYINVTNQQFDHWGPPVRTYQTGSSVTTTIAQNYLNSTQYTSSSSCQSALPANTPWVDQGGSSTNTSVVINANGQQVTTVTESQPQQQTAYTCVSVTAGRRTVYRQYYYTYQRSAYDYTIDTRDPVYITVTTQQFDHWSYQAVTYDTSTYKAFGQATTPTGTNGANETSTWDGCVEERATTRSDTYAFNPLTGKIDPAAATDLDIDAIPDASDPTTKWAPMWPDVAYWRASSSSLRSLTNAATSLYGAKAGSYCPQRSRLLAEMDKSEFDAFTDSLYAEGSTYHDFGIVWGGRLSSPDGMFSSIVNDAPSNGGTVSRHLVFMTDGQMSNNYAIQTSNGIEFHDRRITNDGVSNSESRHTARYQAVCQAIKAKGIRIWVIAYGTGLTTDLMNCASTNSAFTANSSANLNKAFQEIAKQVGELRITQ